MAWDTSNVEQREQSSKDPNWLGWGTHTITTPTPDRSAEIGLKTAGEVLKGSVEVGQDIVGQKAKVGAEDILKQHTADLENTAAKVGANPSLLKEGVLPQGGPGAGPVPAVTEAQPDTPPVAAQAGPQASTLEAARANGAISSTYYYGQLDKLSSDLTARFPWAAEPIRKKIAEATGVSHTAAEYATSLQKDINSYLTGKETTKNEVLSSLNTLSREGHRSADGVLASMIWSDVKNNKITPEQGQDWINRTRAWKYQYDTQTATFHLAQQGKQYNEDTARKVFTPRAYQIVGQVADRVAAEFKFDSGAEMMDAVLHPEKQDPKKMQALAEGVGRLKPMVDTMLDAEFGEVPRIPTGQYKNGVALKSKIDPNTGRPWPTGIELLGNAYPEIKKQALARIETMESLIKDGHIGALAHYSNQEKAADQIVNTEFRNTDLGHVAVLFDTAKKLGLPQEITNSMVERFRGDAAHPGQQMINSAMESLIYKKMLPKSETDRLGLKPSTTMADDIAKLKTNNLIEPSAIRKFVGSVQEFTNPQVPDDIRHRIFMYHFGPGNANVLSNWVQNKVDPTSGEIVDPVTGKKATAEDNLSIYTLMTSKGITDGVRSLDIAYPGTWNQYKSTVSAMTDTLVKPYILDLSKLQYNTNYSPFVHYDSDSNQFIFDRKALQREGLSGTTIDSAKATIDKVNVGLERMRDISHAENGSDPNKYIIETLKQMGYEFNPQSAKTFPDALVQGIMSSQAEYQTNINKAYQKVRDLANPKKNRPEGAASEPEKPPERAPPTRRPPASAPPGANIIPSHHPKFTQAEQDEWDALDKEGKLSGEKARRYKELLDKLR